jgi:hypothetical protein
MKTIDHNQVNHANEPGAQILVDGLASGHWLHIGVLIMENQSIQITIQSPEQVDADTPDFGLTDADFGDASVPTPWVGIAHTPDRTRPLIVYGDSAADVLAIMSETI